MKKYIILLVLLLSAPILRAQNEYFQNNPKWTVLEIWSQTYPCISYDTVTFYLNGDTIINSLTYKKLYAQGTCRNVWMSSNPNMGCGLAPFNYPYTGYTGAIRSSGTAIYFIHDGFTADDTLFDFNLAVGSHVTHSDWTTQDTNVTIVAIDSFYTPYGYKKMYHLSQNPSSFIMEGGGSDFGLYHYIGPMMDFGSYLQCYSLNDTAWWPQQGPDCEAILLGDVETEMKTVSLQVVPNPATEYVDITLIGAEMESVVVYDVFGKAVKQQWGNSKLFVGDLPSGIYTCVVTMGELRISKNLIVE